MNFQKGKGREEPEINLIPFIDVLLVILIFLMITTTYSKFSELPVTLPTADAQQAFEQPNEINVTVDSKGHYAINGTRVAASDAAGLAKELTLAANKEPAESTKESVEKPKSGSVKKDPLIIINADALAVHQKVINVLEAARSAGFAKVTFAAQSSAKK